MLKVPGFACGIERSLYPQKVAFLEIIINIDDFLGYTTVIITRKCNM